VLRAEPGTGCSAPAPHDSRPEHKPAVDHDGVGGRRSDMTPAAPANLPRPCPAVAGFGGGVMLPPVFTVLFGLRATVPMLTLTQL
jgi:hypothetical protein